MLINFVDNNRKIKLSFEEKLPNQEIEILSKNNFSLLNDAIYHHNDVEQLQNNVLNSLNYASNQKLLPSTLPEQLNVKFINVSKLDKLKDKIIPSPIAQ